MTGRKCINALWSSRELRSVSSVSGIYIHIFKCKNYREIASNYTRWLGELGFMLKINW